MGRRSSAFIHFMALLAALTAVGALIVPQAGARAEAALQRLEFITADGPHEFRVELADTPAERAKGLMYRKHMPADQGMLFDFHEEGPVMMWMKNTYIPLDMIFVSRRGVVTHVAVNAAPFSEEIITSGGPAYAVIELNAGAASKIGLKPGDEVRHPAFKR
jgi:uncharacterized membrane protein (UPF0127 family)